MPFPYLRPSFWAQWYRSHVLRFYRTMRHPKELKRSKIKRWISKHFLQKSVWKPNHHTFAGGMACGFFFMMFIIPGQAPLAAILAALLRVNIPIAMLSTWIVNPVTMLPVAYLEIQVGSWALRKLKLANPPEMDWPAIEAAFSKIGDFRLFLNQIEPWILSMYVGALIVGLIAAFAGYAICLLIWELIQMLTHRRSKPD